MEISIPQDFRLSGCVLPLCVWMALVKETFEALSLLTAWVSLGPAPLPSQVPVSQISAVSIFLLDGNKEFSCLGESMGTCAVMSYRIRGLQLGGTSAMTKGTLKPPEGQQIWHDVSAGPAEAFQAL